MFLPDSAKRVFTMCRHFSSKVPTLFIKCADTLQFLSTNIGRTVLAVRTCSKLHQHLYLSVPTPLRMQRGRYSFCGIHSAAILEHAVVGRRLYQADNDDARGFILHRCSPSCPSDYASKPRRAHQSPSGTQGIPGRTRNQRACVLAYGGTTTFCSHRVYFSP